LKIALVILHADPKRGGAERYTFDLTRRLAQRGHQVDLFSSTSAGFPFCSMHDKNIREVIAPPRGVTRLARYRHFLDDLDRHLASNTYDIVHAMLPVRQCDVYHPHAGVAAEAIVTGHRKHTGTFKRSMAAVLNRVNVKRNHFASVERKLLTGDNPPIVLCLSEYVKATLRRHYPNLPDDRLAKLFNAVDLAHFDPDRPPHRNPEEMHDARRLLAAPADAVVGLMVAQDFERKGLREAIEALAQVADPRLRLAVVGKPDPSAYRDLARSLGVENQVTFVGPSTYVYDWYAAADFFLLPTRHDPCSLVVLEALAMGLPVISTKQNGACEIMQPGVHGFVIESADDSRALVEAMRNMTDAEARTKMHGACLELRPALAYDKHLDRLIQIYASALFPDEPAPL
jgi:UDP-glucose:(heptosyl)LPS alpha-1,3-glucosyltransferase